MRQRLCWPRPAARRGGWSSGHDDIAREAASANTGRVLYYQDPSGAPVFSPVPKKDAQGRDFVAVRAPGRGDRSRRDGRFSTTATRWASPTPRPRPKRTRWGWTTSPSMPTRADQPGTVKISPEKVQRLGVRTAEVSRQVLNESVLLSGTVTADERKLARRVAEISRQYREAARCQRRARKCARVKPLFDINSPFLLQQETTLAIALKARAVSQELGDVYARTNERSAASARARLETLRSSQARDRTLDPNAANPGVTSFGPRRKTAR